MRERPFSQVDVFSGTPYRGNPLAVVLDAVDIDDEALARFANWTNLSETTFVLPASPEAAAQGADYRVRIFTPSRELPFAGHPTLGTAHAWLEAGNEPRDPSAVVQECGVGLVRIRREEDRLAFAAPPLARSGPIAADDLAEIAAFVGVGVSDVVDANWIDNGPGWSGVLLASADAVLALEPDFSRLGSSSVGVVGPYPNPAAGSPQFEVRGFAGGAGVWEDPVTGSLNAGLAQWMMAAGHAPDHYIAGQGARLGRDGRVHLDRIDGQVWVGGSSVTCIGGTIIL
ncbi:PhzF family phenazine biosynthesis protein [Subtercola boreus]|uniref:Phenazine biosynthesis protein PhzF n=1 Tax=Subtercola boreus TaxID=120213 RepID=A0A3E0WF11_9MICO|nr:PhzF family phenazine biosynthesis protein [Subtercola boreus]RFA23356.1 phenazine biosynthesis protein PhzF [Subtercola boreus]RFA23749.1 phenazine biosynthesis protein PhzF [Subtercola boreus]RFA29449.1 phenazine biosynthesis protein PhzF [Subtercola boreus]